MITSLKLGLILSLLVWGVASAFQCEFNDYCNEEVVVEIEFGGEGEVYLKFLNEFRDVSFDKRYIPLGYEVGGTYINLVCKEGIVEYIGKITNWEASEPDLYVFKRDSSFKIGVYLKDIYSISSDASKCYLSYTKSLQDWDSGQTFFVFGAKRVPEDVLRLLIKK